MQRKSHEDERRFVRLPPHQALGSSPFKGEVGRGMGAAVFVFGFGPGRTIALVAGASYFLCFAKESNQRKASRDCCPVTASRGSRFVKGSGGRATTRCAQTGRAQEIRRTPPRIGSITWRTKIKIFTLGFAVALLRSEHWCLLSLSLLLTWPLTFFPVRRLPNEMGLRPI
jgi:hypothetical protein